MDMMPLGRRADISQVRILSSGLLDEVQEFRLQYLRGHFESVTDHNMAKLLEVPV